MQRHGMVIGIEKKDIAEYKRLHADVRPGVLKMIHKANLRNYSIYLGEVEKNKYYLFGYYEYVGSDYIADMARIAKDVTTQQWWKHTDALQKPLPTRKEGEWWAEWELVFYLAGPQSNKKPVRYGSIIGMPKENILPYTQMHVYGWPGVHQTIINCNIRNYSIFLGQIEPDEYLLFSYFEYIGDDFKADMAKMAQDPVTQAWWKYTDPLQRRLPGTPHGQQWKTIQEVFHID